MAGAGRKAWAVQRGRSGKSTEVSEARCREYLVIYGSRMLQSVMSESNARAKANPGRSRGRGPNSHMSAS